LELKHHCADTGRWRPSEMLVLVWEICC